MWARYRSARGDALGGWAAAVAGTARSKHTARALWSSRHGMQTLIALLVAAAAACAIARPPGPTATPGQVSLQAQLGPQMVRAPPPPPREILGEYLLPRFFLPHYLGYDDSPRVPPPPPLPENDWLNKEIDRLNQMEEEEEEIINPYEMDIASLISQDPYMQRIFDGPLSVQEPIYAPEFTENGYENMKPLRAMEPAPHLLPSMYQPQEEKREPLKSESHSNSAVEEHRKKFALTPMDKEYYQHDVPTSYRPANKQGEPAHPAGLRGGAPEGMIVLEPPRQTRQNPNLSKQKHLLEPDLGKLKTGLANKDYRLPVSLLPSNLRWLKVNQPQDSLYDTESGHEEQHKQPVQVLESATDPVESIYDVALIAAVGAAVTMALVGFAFGWYTLSKKAKAAADVEYPAYGVTGPTVDTSADRKLAHSAHMYHYQHQKQQIIAMERNGMEQRAGSVSDPESEEENEEGDYTVYECPGFATTGDMEVKNPLFSEDPTPTTPGRCEVVKPQPKD